MIILPGAEQQERLASCPLPDFSLAPSCSFSQIHMPGDSIPFSSSTLSMILY